MIVKGMPILHARTYNVDFRTGKLLVCPEVFNDSEAKFCYRVAQDSTIFRELSPPEGRTVVYGNGKYLVVGKTVVFKDLYESCGLTPKYIRVDSPKGRFAYGFAGATFAIKDISEPFDFPEKTILKIYEHYIKDRWDETYGSNGVHESTLSVPIELEVEKMTCKDRKVDSHLQKRDAKIAIEDTAENRNNVIYCVQQRALNGEKISLCTSLGTEKAIKESCFEIVTCEGAENIRLRTEIAERSAPIISTSTEKSSGNESHCINMSKPHVTTGSMKEQISADRHPRKATSFTEEIENRSAPKINSDFSNESYRINTSEPHVMTRSTKEQISSDSHPRKATSFTEEIESRSVPKIDPDSNIFFSAINFLSGKKKTTKTAATSLSSSDSEQSGHSWLV